MKLRRFIATAVVAFFAAIMIPVFASAHTTRICWQDVGPVTTFYAGSYHHPTEGPSPIGGIIIDGFEYPFSGWVYPAAIPAGAQCAQASGFSSAPAVVHYQTFTSSFPAGAHTVTFTATNVVQAPWGAFPSLTFGGGACADADFDGICNTADACPLDFNNDGDGDGICGNVDNCPLNANPDQADANFNGQGDACEGVVCGNGLRQGAEQCDDGNKAGGDGCSALCTIELADVPPNANAGSDQSVSEGQAVTLDGTLSNDADNEALTYAWVQVGGAPATLTGANTSGPTFTAPTVAFGGGTLDFQLTVTANGVSDSDTVAVTVANVNHVPVSEAGVDQSVAEGAPVTLDGSGSFDSDSDAFTYSWTQQSGPAVTMAGSTTATPTFTAPTVSAGGAPGVVATLVFKLSVDDGLPRDTPADGYTLADSDDTVIIAVTNTNNLPTADAGTDMTLNEHAAVALNANGSTDPDGDPLTYEWIQTGGPAVVLTDATTATPSLTTPFVSAGGVDLTFQVTADDGYGGTASDTVVVHVQNANDPPLASAATPTIACLWSPDHKFVSVGITGVTDPENNATITITSVTQDEPTNGLGDGDTAIDAVINADGTVLLRAERSGKGDGRVYHIHFTASDLEGSASGVVTVCVQHNQKRVAIDSGQLYDSTM